MPPWRASGWQGWTTEQPHSEIDSGGYEGCRAGRTNLGPWIREGKEDQPLCVVFSIGHSVPLPPPPQGTGVPVGLSSPKDGTVPPAHRLMPLLRDTTSSSADVQSAQMSLLELNVRVRSYLG